MGFGVWPGFSAQSAQGTQGCAGSLSQATLPDLASNGPNPGFPANVGVSSKALLSKLECVVIGHAWIADCELEVICMACAAARLP